MGDALTQCPIQHSSSYPTRTVSAPGAGGHAVTVVAHWHAHSGRPLGTGVKTVGNSRKTSQSFFTLTFKYENKIKSGKIGRKKEHELTKYQERRKRTNSSGIMSNTVGIRKINTEY